MQKRKTATRTFSIPLEIYKAFNELCEANNYNKSAIATSLIAAFVEYEKNNETEHHKYTGKFVEEI